VAHDCQVTAELGGATYPCQEHRDGKHVFAAHWPKCPAPWCRLPPGHRSLHDVPAGTPKITAPVAEIRALTVKQPYAHLIAHCGKTPENRTRATPYRGLVAVHAGAYSRWDRDAESSPAAVKAWREWAARWTYAGQPVKPLTRDGAFQLATFGAVIAVATLAGCHRDEDSPMHRSGAPACSPWAVRGAWHWELTGVRPLAEPVPCRGMLGLWKLPEDAEKAVRAQMEEAGHG
jgi:hypothetical protein